jgi:DNA polymerase III subunit delta'
MPQPDRHDRLPWHQAAWDLLQARRARGNLPHGLLLAGARGLGKLHFARQLAESLLCERPAADGHACGECRACALLQADTHPDLHLVGPLEDSKDIRIDQVRELTARLALSAQYGHKVAILTPADRMNTAAVNSLLKTLEEPPERTLLLLLTARPSRLPATVRSRCQHLVFHEPPRELAERWLASRSGRNDPALLLDLAGGAPLLALTYATDGTSERRLERFSALEQVLRGGADPVGVAQRWMADSPDEVLGDLAGWLIDMIRLRSAARPPRLANRDLTERLHKISKGLDLPSLYAQLDRVAEAARLAGGQINLQLLLEDVLIAWARPGEAGSTTSVGHYT